MLLTPAEQAQKTAFFFARSLFLCRSGLCGTRETIELSKEAQRLGVDALSIVCPYFAPVSQEGLYAHFSEIAAAVSLPIILYNIPARTGVNLAPARSPTSSA